MLYISLYNFSVPIWDSQRNAFSLFRICISPHLVISYPIKSPKSDASIEKETWFSPRIRGTTGGPLSARNPWGLSNDRRPWPASARDSAAQWPIRTRTSSGATRWSALNWQCENYRTSAKFFPGRKSRSTPPIPPSTDYFPRHAAYKISFGNFKLNI